MCSNTYYDVSMTTRTAYQGSLLESVDAQPRLGPLAGRLERTRLTLGAWVDVLPAWMCDSDGVFLDLVESTPWRAERRQMYERMVDVPRLVCFYDEGEALPHPILGAARDALTAHYRSELGEPFTTT